MAQYRVQGPDGSMHIIEGPDNASQQDIEAAAASLVPKAQPQVQTDDPGALGAGWIGVGRMGDRLLQGIKQASLGYMGLTNPAMKPATDQALAEQAQEQASKNKSYAELQQQHPLATSLGEAALLAPAPMGGSVKAAMALGSIPGLLEYGTSGERATRGALGAMGSGIGYGVGKGIGAVLSPGMEAATPETGRLAQAMQQAGIPLDAAQVTGNPVLQNTKAALDNIPWTAAGQKAQREAQQGAYNNAILKYIGSDEKAATPDVMGDAYNAIVGKMNGAAQNAGVTMDDAAIAKLADVEKNFTRRLPTDQKAVIKSYLDDLTNSIGTTIPGDVYAKTRSALGQLAFNTDNITLREGAKGMQKVLDDAFDRQNPTDVVQAMKEARAQYAKYQTVADAIKKARSTDGSIPAKQLYAQAQQDIPGFERGAGGDFNTLVRGGRQFLPDPVGNSGTAQRALYQNLVTAGSMSGLGALGGALPSVYGGESHPISGAALGALGFATSKGAQRMLNSPLMTRYLMAQVLDDQTKGLLGKAGASAGLLGVTAATR